MENIENPKVRGRKSSSSTWFRFYPGFSEAFARSVLSSVALNENEWVLDPWNGGGTTTSTATSLGLNSHGYDLNPVMVIVSKARCLDEEEYSSLQPLEAEIRRKAVRPFDVQVSDPLLTWLVPNSVEAFRTIEAAIQTLLVDDLQYKHICSRGTDALSGLASFFYIAIFRTLKKLLLPFLTSNPTWIKRPVSVARRLRPSRELVQDTFRLEVASMLQTKAAQSSCAKAKRVLKVASSERLPLPDNSVNCVLSSPPYCTRIDYAVATWAELALLGFGPDSGFNNLRRRLLGSTTVPEVAPSLGKHWGGTCENFLSKLRSHTSKASATYYYKSHARYFDCLSRSVSEIARVLKPSGKCFLVVQDSYYKDLHNDLPVILTEMLSARNFVLEQKKDFLLSRTMAGIHPGTKAYRTHFGAIESVLVMRKQC